MQAAADGVVSVRSWAPSPLQNDLQRSFLKGYEGEMVGCSKARGKGVRAVRGKTDESCLHVRMDWKSHVLNPRLLRLCKKFKQS